MSFIFFLLAFALMYRQYWLMLPPHTARKLGFDGKPLLFDDD